MIGYRIEQTERLRSEDVEFWTEALRERDFGQLFIPWTEAVRVSGPGNLEIHYLQIFEGKERRALAVLHLLRKLDLGGYMGGAMKGFFSLLAKTGWRPLATNLAFVEVPIGNKSGIGFAPGAHAHSQEITAAILEHVRKNFDYHVLSVKASPSLPGEAAFGEQGLLKTPFLANMVLRFKGERNFEDYLKRLNAKNRWRCRSYIRVFEGAGCTIEITENFDDRLFELMNRLYAQTLRHHAENSNLQLPIPVGPEFFPQLMASLPGKCRVFLVKQEAETIAFALLLDCGDRSYFTHCGLDYARTIPSRAYFNLYHAMIADSIGRGKRELGLGAEAYAVKEQLGAEPCPTMYHFEVRNPVLRAIASFVAKNFASQDGSKKE